MDPPWIKVIETNTVPKTRNANGMFLVEGDEKEPLGKRILETPANAEATEVLRDPHSPFFAYVPPGSIKKGEALVTKASGKTTQCGRLSWSGSEGPRPGAGYRGPFTQLSGATNVRYAARHAQRRVDSADETSRRQFERRRHYQHRGVHLIADSLSAGVT